METVKTDVLKYVKIVNLHYDQIFCKLVLSDSHGTAEKGVKDRYNVGVPETVLSQDADVVFAVSPFILAYLVGQEGQKLFLCLFYFFAFVAHKAFQVLNVLAGTAGLA